MARLQFFKVVGLITGNTLALVGRARKPHAVAGSDVNTKRIPCQFFSFTARGFYSLFNGLCFVSRVFYHLSYCDAFNGLLWGLKARYCVMGITATMFARFHIRLSYHRKIPPYAKRYFLQFVAVESLTKRLLHF